MPSREMAALLAMAADSGEFLFFLIEGEVD